MCTWSDGNTSASDTNSYVIDLTGGNTTTTFTYPWYYCTCKKSTKLVLEGTPEELAKIIEHFKGRIRIEVEQLG